MLKLMLPSRWQKLTIDLVCKKQCHSGKLLLAAQQERSFKEHTLYHSSLPLNHGKTTWLSRGSSSRTWAPEARVAMGRLGCGYACWPVIVPASRSCVFTSFCVSSFITFVITLMSPLAFAFSFSCSSLVPITILGFCFFNLFVLLPHMTHFVNLLIFSPSFLLFWILFFLSCPFYNWK